MRGACILFGMETDYIDALIQSVSKPMAAFMRLAEGSVFTLVPEAMQAKAELLEANTHLTLLKNESPPSLDSISYMSSIVEDKMKMSAKMTLDAAKVKQLNAGISDTHIHQTTTNVIEIVHQQLKTYEGKIDVEEFMGNMAAALTSKVQAISHTPDMEAQEMDASIPFFGEQVA